MSVIRLDGCRLQPLGSYLKGLSVLRLVAEQEHREARGWWDQGCFHLDSKLDADALVEFFLQRYAPTPIVSPWNGGSGFYPKDRKVGIDAIAGSEAERFSMYRDAIEGSRSIVRQLGGEKAAATADEAVRRRNIQLACRNLLPDGTVEWLDAAVGISSEDERTFAPILGTGGNEGRLDYTNNLMEYLTDLLIAPDGKTPVRELLRNALFGTATKGLQPSAVGQYDPGLAGGFNQGQGVSTGDVPSNPWNFVLTLEGAVAWAAGLYRRQGVAYRSFLCSPFTVRSTPVGYGSSAAKDKDAARAEIWAPVWGRPASYPELRALLREGRASIDGKPAQNGLEFAEAACMLGVDRGVSAFMRYNLLKRRGDSYIALPVGRFKVEDRTEADLVRELNGVLDAVDRQMKSPPAGFESLRRQVDEAMYNVLLKGGDAALEDLAASIGRLHRRILMTGKEVRLPAALSGKWLERLGERSEARIAAALASMWDRNSNVPRMLDHLMAANGGAFSWQGSTFAERMARTLQRRVRLLEQVGLERNPLGSSYRARLGDVTSFLEESLDDERIEDLFFAFMLVNWKKQGTGSAAGREEVGVWPVYAVLKHLFYGEKVNTGEGEEYLLGDMRVVAALIANDVGHAMQTATRRLQNRGIARAEMQDPAGFDGTRLAAALLIPVPYGRMMQNFFKTSEDNKND